MKEPELKQVGLIQYDKKKDEVEIQGIFPLDELVEKMGYLVKYRNSK